MEASPTEARALLLCLYFAVLLVLSLYGAYRARLVWLVWKRPMSLPPSEPPADAPAVPSVTVQLPLYNERFVATRLIDAACRLTYPREKLEIQVLDDSSDETTLLVARAVERWRRCGVNIRHLRRASRRGYKAGALAHGLKSALGELIAVFDADFVPPSDFLNRTVPHFRRPDVGLVQARWTHLNRERSWLTRAQALLLDGHFAVEHAARHRCGAFFNFNGTAGIWRRLAIEEAGGWAHDTLTEDLDLSYRAQLAGWTFVYDDAIGVPAELPSDIEAFKSQQHRWAKGSVETARKLLGRILRADLPLRVRGHAFFHLTANLVWPLMVLLSILMPPAAILRTGQGFREALLVDLPIFLCATVSVCLFYLASQRRIERRSGWRLLVDLPLTLAVGVGLAVNNSRAVLEALLGRRSPFVRTPKSGETDGEKRVALGYLESGGWQSLVELGLGAYLVGCVPWLLDSGAWATVPFVSLFAAGYLLVGGASLRAALGARAPASPAALASNRSS